jgi:hypothetical protein
MNPDIPILMITLQIPVTPDTTADEVLDAIGRQVSDALHEFKEQQNAATQTLPVDEEFKASVPRETDEGFTHTTREDLLSRLGYRSRA